MRRLLWVPIVHSAADLGSLAGRARTEYSAAGWARHEQQIASYWGGIVSALDALSLDYAKVKIYHDSMVTDGDLGKKIVRELARNGSADYMLTERLIDSGARLMKTEDIELLLQEYQAYSRSCTSPQELENVLTQRDLYVARRIDKTLNEGEIGILFMGAAHQVCRVLPCDISIEEVGIR